MDWEKIKETVKRSQQAVSRPCEKCGGKYTPSGQALGFSVEDQCLADFMTFKCESCGNTVSVTVPLRGEPYKSIEKEIKDK
jgi:hypothetical protein